MNPLCSFIITYMPTRLVGGLSQQEMEANWLEKVLEEGEVLEVVKVTNSDKAPTQTAILWPFSKLAQSF